MGRKLSGLMVLIGLISTGMTLIGAMVSPGDSSMAGKPHHTSDGFRNTHQAESPGFTDFLKWRWDRLWMDIPGPEAYTLPVVANDGSVLRSNHNETTLTWIGHATVLLQLNGKNILTDPHFSDRASPVQFAGPKRVVPPGVELDDLPFIDAIVLSHDHYDSLDKGTVRRLRDREGGERTRFFVPLGLKKWFEDLGVTNVTELDWWAGARFDDLEFICVPVHHWSQRAPFTRNSTLWAGWVIRSDNFRFFFGGDSGYTPHFKEIGDRLGPFDLAAIPIGAYEPRWFMRHHHISPEEAVQVHQDVKSRKSVGIHWGTFILTDEPLDEPPKRLAKAKDGRNVPEDAFVVLKHGETMRVSP